MDEIKIQFDNGKSTVSVEATPINTLKAISLLAHVAKDTQNVPTAVILAAVYSGTNDKAFKESFMAVEQIGDDTQISKDLTDMLKSLQGE